MNIDDKISNLEERRDEIFEPFERRNLPSQDDTTNETERHNVSEHNPQLTDPSSSNNPKLNQSKDECSSAKIIPHEDINCHKQVVEIRIHTKTIHEVDSFDSSSRHPVSRQVESAPIPSLSMSNEPSAPDSLTSAPPSYSLVMRQIHAPRTRFMGTFVSSPSFVQQPPPPTYAATFDLYVDPTITPIQGGQPYNYGFHPLPVVCFECGNLILTAIRSQLTICTHLCAALLCICFCWICVPLPYILRSCKNVYHYCPICNTFLGMYSPTNSSF